jgi:hypothetical protein
MLLRHNKGVRNPELRRLLDRTAAETLRLNRPSGRSLPQGVELLDHWLSVPFGAVLFHIPGACDLSPWGRAHFDFTDFGLVDGSWEKRGGGGHGTEAVAGVGDRRGPGLHRIGAGRHDEIRLSTAVATCDVAWIELQIGGLRTRRQLGTHGYCLLGTTQSEPDVYAQGIDGLQLPLGPAFLL